METIFSKTLKRLRKAAGFRTAYQFYHGNGGRGVLKVSYRSWLFIEQGRTLPAFKTLGALMCALRLVPNSADGIELVMTWLKTAHGPVEVEHFLAPLLKSPPRHAISSPLHKVIHRSLSQAKFHITPRQLEAMGRCRENYLCWLALSNDSGKWTPNELSAELGLSAASTGKAMKELQTAGLLKKLRGGLYICPMAGAMLEYPARWTLLAAQKKAIELRTDLIAKGEEVYSRRGILRASLPELSNFFPMLALNTSAAQTYAVTEKEKGSALFAVESRVVKIHDF